MRFCVSGAGVLDGVGDHHRSQRLFRLFRATSPRRPAHLSVEIVVPAEGLPERCSHARALRYRWWTSEVETRPVQHGIWSVCRLLGGRKKPRSVGADLVRRRQWRGHSRLRADGKAPFSKYGRSTRTPRACEILSFRAVIHCPSLIVASPSSERSNPAQCDGDPSRRYRRP